MKFLIILIITSFLFLNKKDSIDLKKIESMLKNNKTKSIDSTNMKINLNSGIDMNFIPKDPSKGRLGDFVIGNEQILKIKETAKNYTPSPLSDNDIVTLETTKGTIRIKLFNDLAPNHSLNFKKLCNSGFYDGTSFHRVIKEFMIQGGDILSRDKDRNNDGTGSPGWTIDSEFSDTKHKRGILSMARSNNPNSAGSQFFICVKDSPWLDGQYSVFGEVIDGMDVVDKIVNVPTDRDMMLLRTVNAIPQDENKDHWIEVMDYKTRRKLYSKIPLGDNKTGYSDKVRKDLRSDNPYRRIEIITARVYFED